MQVHAAVLPEPLEVVAQAIVVLASADSGLDLPIKGLNSHLKLQRSRRESGN